MASFADGARGSVLLPSLITKAFRVYYKTLLILRARTTRRHSTVGGPSPSDATSMSDRAITLLLDRLRSIAARKQRFSYDVRGNSYVTSDLVAAYAVPTGKDGMPDLETVLQHALDHDAVVSGERLADGRMLYTSCRLFTDAHNAITFAKAHGQSSVYNWNRWAEVAVTVDAPTAATSTMLPPPSAN